MNDTRLLGGKFCDYFGLQRNVVVLLAVLLVISAGEEMWSRFAPKYLEALGGTALLVGVYGTLKDLLDAIYQYPGGVLADRLGRKRALLLFTLLAIIGYVIYALSANPIWFLVGTLFVMAWSSLSLPATFAIVGDNLPQNRRAIGFGVQSILKRLPKIVAPPLGGWLLWKLGTEQGFRVAVAATVVLALFAMWWQLAFRTASRRWRSCSAACARPAKPRARRSSWTWRMRNAARRTSACIIWCVALW